MFERSIEGHQRNSLSDWMLRGGIALIFIAEGIAKFGAGSSWVKMFEQIGFGKWFRDFAGIVEVLGGIFVLIPGLVTAGLLLLASTMACAALILTFRLGRPQDSVFSGALFIGLSVFWWSRRSA